MINHLLKALLALSVLAVAGTIAFATLTFQQLKQAEIKNQAQAECAMAYRYTKSDTSGVTVSYPMEELYQKCLSQKTIK